ncbi:MAG: HlyD family efflux transporter periplasmic adaptor subunit [Gemmatimonadetes bacterium]|nr:HlyD family efflux transporter periplasmic adaptor subunit [Gemmatimonadota bacterium]
MSGGDLMVPRLPSAQLHRAHERHWRIGRILLVMLGVAVGIAFLPWQQNVQGRGAVTALRPQDRPQVVPALIAGRIESWHVAEGERVRKGQLLLTLSEVKESFLDPRVVERTLAQVDGKATAIDAKRAKVAALTQQLEALTRARELNVGQARNRIAEAEASVVAAELDSVVAARQLERNRALFDDGLKSRVDLEAHQVKAQAMNARLVEKRQSLTNARLEVSAVDADYADKYAKAVSERSATVAEIGEGEADVAKLRSTHASLALRNEMYRIVAPQDGYVVRAIRSGVGETVKEGEPVVTVMPADPQVAVELYVRPMDVPLLSPGRKVRLQFDGWPALQFSGWPSVAVGTFGGEIRVVDYVNAADGSYRVLVVPDPRDEAWPKELRVGSGVLGWTMLDEVRVGYEVWRRLNGFPPAVNLPPTAAAKPVK